MTWSLAGTGILNISGSGSMTDYTGSNAPWNASATSIYAVVISDGVTSIGSNAFDNSNKILFVSVPASVGQIGDNAFNGCTELKVVNYSGTEEQKNTLTVGENNNSLLSADWYYSSDNSIGMGATSGSCGRKTVWALSSDGTLTVSGTGTMNSYTADAGKPWEARKSSIKAVVVSEGVTSIGDYAFRDCPNLASVSLPEGLKSIGQYAFSNCDKLASVAVPDGIAIGNYAFSYCDSLARIELGSEVRTGSYAFADCDKLTTLTLKEGLQSIGEHAFDNCDRLTKVTVPESMESIGSYAFIDCSALRTVTIPEGLERIGSYSFAGCNSLTGIQLPSSLTTLGEGTFGYSSHYGINPCYRSCTSFSSVVLSESITEIPYKCFENCNLTEVTIPEGIETIRANAFYSNTSLEAIYLPVSMGEIASNAFAECSSLTDVYYAGTQAQAEEILIGTENTYLSSATWHCAPTHMWSVTYTWSDDNSEITATRTCSLHDDEIETETVAVEAQITLAPTQNSTGEYCYVSNPFTNPAFETQYKLISGIPALKDMNILKLPSYLLVIETEAFSGLNCDAVIVPEGCETIQSKAFAECKNLKYVFIPKTVINIAEDAFINCPDVILDIQK